MKPGQASVRLPFINDQTCQKRVNDSSRDWRWLSRDGVV
jgi:hypothetical protein